MDIRRALAVPLAALVLSWPGPARAPTLGEQALPAAGAAIAVPPAWDVAVTERRLMAFAPAVRVENADGTVLVVPPVEVYLFAVDGEPSAILQSGVDYYSALGDQSVTIWTAVVGYTEYQGLSPVLLVQGLSRSADGWNYGVALFAWRNAATGATGALEIRVIGAELDRHDAEIQDIASSLRAAEPLPSKEQQP